MLHLDDALTLLDHANDGAAADVLGTLAVETPAHATVHVLLAQACERLHRWDAALAAWQTARLLVPELSVVQQGTLRAAQVLAALQTLREPSAAPETPSDASTFADAGPSSSFARWPDVEPASALSVAASPLNQGGPGEWLGSDRLASDPAPVPAAASPEPTAAADPHGAAPDPYAAEAPAEPLAAASVVSNPYPGSPAPFEVPGSPAPAAAIPVPAPPPPAPVQASAAPSAPSGSPSGSIFFDPFATAAQARRRDEPVGPAEPVDSSAAASDLPSAPAPVLPPTHEVAPPAFVAPATALPPGEAAASFEADRLGEAVWSEPTAPVPRPLAPPPTAPVPAIHLPASPSSASGPPTVDVPAPVPLPSDPRLPGVPDTFDLDDLIESLSTAGRIVPRADLDAVPPPTGLDADDADDVVSPTLARIFAAQGQTADAIRAYERLAAAHPDRAADFLAEADALRRRPSSR